MAERVPRASPPSRVGDVLADLAGRSFESLANVAVLDGDRFQGVVPLEALLAAPTDATMEELLANHTPTVPADTDQELAAWRAAKSPTGTVAVRDDEGCFVGLVPPKRLLPVLLHEHEEDLARLGGVLSRQSAARSAAEEAVPRRLWHRLPWLVIGLLGAMASAGIVASFEDDLRDEVLLAFFVPAVVYMADAVGTQTETVVIRGLSVGVPIRRVLRVEVLSGIVIGVAIAAGFFGFAIAVWGELDVALSVALALFASASAATVIAMSLPYLLNRLGLDPAFGSGPLATVVQDLFSIVVYFLIAVALVD
jgi:magnesium transporter